MFLLYNPNKLGKKVGDCAVRALTKALGVSWNTAYNLMTEKGFDMADMPSSNSVWGAVLKDHGFERFTIPNECPDCYTNSYDDSSYRGRSYDEGRSYARGRGRNAKRDSMGRYSRDEYSRNDEYSRGDEYDHMMLKER